MTVTKALLLKTTLEIIKYYLDYLDLFISSCTQTEISTPIGYFDSYLLFHTLFKPTLNKPPKKLAYRYTVGVNCSAHFPDKQQIHCHKECSCPHNWIQLHLQVQRSPCLDDWLWQNDVSQEVSRRLLKWTIWKWKMEILISEFCFITNTAYNLAKKKK